jgi:hypothetical protein
MHTTRINSNFWVVVMAVVEILVEVVVVVKWRVNWRGCEGVCDVHRVYTAV